MTDQWTLNRRNFAGHWQGCGHWFERDGSDRLDLQHPSRRIDPTTYVIAFSDDDHGVWDGSGLALAPGGQATYSISRDTYNTGGGCWQFPGAGGQSSLRLDPKQQRFGHEINLFCGRSRAMLVLLWEPLNGRWRLQRVGAVGFRCRNSADPAPNRPASGTPETLLAPLQGWTGERQMLRPQPGVNGQAVDSASLRFNPSQLLRNNCSAVMPDGLVFSVPSELPEQPFSLEIGGHLSTTLFQQISIHFDAAGQLLAWERRRFRPADGTINTTQG
ncbi:MAG: hypothetical protein ACON4T_07695 [Synechococcus sp.]